jgi:hypothetical protein
MICRNLTRRLERLEYESCFRPDAEPIVLTIEYVDKDGKVVSQEDITLPAPARRRKRLWRGC